MSTRFLASIAGLALIAGGNPAVANTEPAALEAPDMNPDYGPWGVALDELDNNVAPGDDFFAHVNGKWVARTQIPSFTSRFGAFNVLSEKSIRDVEALVAELVASNPAPGTSERRIVDAYNAFFDLEAIDATGLAPIYPLLSQISTATDLARLAQLWQEPGFPALISAGVTVDSKNPDAYIVALGFDGMGLPDRDFYLVDSEKNLEIRAAYKAYLTFLLGKAGYGDPAAAAEAVYAFERDVAALEWDRRMLRVTAFTYNAFGKEDLLALSPEFPMQEVLSAGGFAGQERFLARQIPPTDDDFAEAGLTPAQTEGQLGGGLPAMMDLLTRYDLATLKAWMAAQTLDSFAATLTSELDDASFAFNAQTLNGVEEQRDRSERAIASTQGKLGEELAALYVARHFPPEAKARMDEMVANLLQAMGLFLDQNTWMTPQTREEARAKLATFIPMIGHPDVFETYEGLEIAADDPVGNVLRSTAWQLEDSRSQLGQSVDKREWLILPSTVNAYYAPVFNQIVFPAAILQPPFFNLEADEAVNYGAIGAVIGHEIGHGFDDSGSRYDGSGALRNWWQPADRAYFEAEADKLKALIEQYCPIQETDGELCLRGDLSIGETMGDVVGIQMAYQAYRLALGDKEAPVIDGLTGDQRFFLAYAQVRRSKDRPEALRQRVITANHPPAEFRVNNTVRHIDAWYTAFDVGPEHALYLPPEERVQIWER